MLRTSRYYTLAATLALTCAALPVLAQSAATPWPAKPIHYIVPFSPGGVSDGVGR